MSDFLPLSPALSGRLHLSFEDLPADLRERVESAFVIPWNRLTPQQRRRFAARWDYDQDPATERERKTVAELFDKMEATEKEIEKWESIGTPTARDLSIQEDRLQSLYKTRAELKATRRRMRGDYCGDHLEPKEPPPQIESRLLSEAGKRNAILQHADRNRLYSEAIKEARSLWVNGDTRLHSDMAQHFKSKYPSLSLNALREKLVDLASKINKPELIRGTKKKG